MGDVKTEPDFEEIVNDSAVDVHVGNDTEQSLPPYVSRKPEVAVKVEPGTWDLYKYLFGFWIGLIWEI